MHVLGEDDHGVAEGEDSIQEPVSSHTASLVLQTDTWFIYKHRDTSLHSQVCGDISPKLVVLNLPKIVVF